LVLSEPQPKNHHHQQLGFGFNDSTNVCPTDLQILITINPVELAPQKLKTHSKFPIFINLLHLICSGGATPGHNRSNDPTGRSTALAPPCILLCFVW